MGRAIVAIARKWFEG